MADGYRDGPAGNAPFDAATLRDAGILAGDGVVHERKFYNNQRQYLSYTSYTMHPTVRLKSYVCVSPLPCMHSLCCTRRHAPPRVSDVTSFARWI